MSMQFLDLGKAKFASSRADLLLEITAIAGLLCENDRHSNMSLSESWGTFTICEDVWLCKSHDFRMSFAVSFDSDTGGPSGIEDKHLEDIQNELETTQVILLTETTHLAVADQKLSFGNS